MSVFNTYLADTQVEAAPHQPGAIRLRRCLQNAFKIQMGTIKSCGLQLICSAQVWSITCGSSPLSCPSTGLASDNSSITPRHTEGSSRRPSSRKHFNGRCWPPMSPDLRCRLTSTPLNVCGQRDGVNSMALFYFGIRQQLRSALQEAFASIKWETGSRNLEVAPPASTPSPSTG